MPFMINVLYHSSKFLIPNKLVIDLSSRSAVPKFYFISNHKTRKVISKGCIYHIVYDNDLST